MATQKPVRLLYQSKALATGLTDVKAQVYLNNVAKAVGASALALTELDATNSPGIYELLIPGATLTSYGVTAGSYNALEITIDSASKSAPAPWRGEITVSNNDDLEAHLVLQDVAIAAVKADTAAIKVDLESGASSLANILAAVTAIQNNAGFSIPVPTTLIKPASGSNTYRLPVTIYNEKNLLVDPDTNSIVVTLVNQAGADRSSYLVGVSGTSAPAVRDSQGQYHIDLGIPSTAAQEELIFTFSYAIGGAATARKAVTEVITDVAADGFALQTTLLSVQTTASSTNTAVLDSTNGLVAIKAAIVANNTEITSNVEGTGFVSSTDSLHGIRLFLAANIYVGGKAV